MTKSLETQTQSSARSTRTAAPVMAARLTVVHPPELATCVELREQPVVLGRQPGAGVALAHATVSRRHLAISFDARARVYLASDLGSHNGTHLDGAPLGSTPTPLQDNAVLMLGDVLAVFEVLPAEGLVAAPEVDVRAAPGEAVSILALRHRLQHAARDVGPLLLHGETGTGKERLAAEVHRLSGRRGPLVSVNVAALSPNLVESELFGHAKGAFTGATEAGVGLFRAADGGTLFLDEVGELPMALQPKLLRAVQEGEVMPVGTTRVHRVDVRVVTATHRDLEAGVVAGTFRRDLQARLGVWTVVVPPLRQRRRDLLDWLDRLQAVWSTTRKDVPGRAPPLGPAAAHALLCHSWPDNLRGLERLLRDVAGAKAGGPLSLEHLPAWVLAAQRPAQAAAVEAQRTPPAALGPATPPPGPARPTGRRESPTAQQLQDALRDLGSVRAVAKHFGRERRQVYRWMAAHGLASPAEEPDQDGDDSAG